MPEDPHAFIARHVAALEDGGASLPALLSRSWPGGGDRSEPAAAQWLRRWTPARGFVAPTACGCAAGRCAVCN